MGLHGLKSSKIPTTDNNHFILMKLSLIFFTLTITSIFNFLQLPPPLFPYQTTFRLTEVKFI
jgi:hypothetical protein